MSSPPDFKGDFLTEQHADFSKSLDRWAANARREAKIVAFVKDNQDVTIALKYAKEHGLPVAIRGGGHSVSGASSIEGGLVIDLSRYLVGCRIDAENKRAYVGGGAVYVTVEEAAIQHGLATISGNDSSTGVGGLSLGGGIGALSGEFGLAVDNIVQATVVTADGSILTVNDKENEDLFFGIRGGGSNFGVCTEIVFRLHHQRRTVYAGDLIFPGNALEALIAVHVQREAAGEISPKELVAHMLVIGPDGNPLVILSLFYNGSEAEGKAHFKKFLDLSPIFDKTAEIPYEKVGTLQQGNFKHGISAYTTSTNLSSLSFANSAKAVEAIKSFAALNPQMQAVLAYEIMNWKKVMSVPLDATAFQRRGELVAAIIFMWDGISEEKTKLAKDFSKKLSGILHEGSSSLTPISERLGYANADGEATIRDDAKVALVFGSNYRRLQMIKKKYDPEQVFNRWFPVVPAL
ncbi:hypothetical protein C8J56DRAFT_882129 [Mycena floridula]|nr:hypothetical protein C8J56DRAFT_882129 [Mycena floridula]